MSVLKYKNPNTGVYVPYSNTKRFSIVDNVITSTSDNAIYHRVKATDSDGMTLTIKGNVVTGPPTHRAILISSNIIGAIVEGNVVLGGNVGIRVTSAASKAIVKDNNLLGATAGLLVDAPSSIVSDNLLP